jgi:hypothetical protein
LSVSRSPPAVTFPLRRSAALATFLCALVVLGACAIVGWVLFRASAGLLLSLAFLMCLLSALASLQLWLHQINGWVQCDGTQWFLQPSRHPDAIQILLHNPEVILDLQAHLWLRVTLFEDRRSTWLWLARSHDPDRWLDLRRAVYSRASPGSDTADEFAQARDGGA